MKTLQTFLKEANAQYHTPHPDTQIILGYDKDGDPIYKTFMGNVTAVFGHGEEDDDTSQRSLREAFELPGWQNKKWDLNKRSPNVPVIRETQDRENFDPAQHDFIVDPNKSTHWHISQYTDNLLRNLPKVRRAIGDYTTSGYEYMNKHLHGSLGYDLPSWYTESMNDLTKGIAEHGEIPQSQVVYTGIKYHPWDYPIRHGVIKVGNPSFVSTTLDPYVGVQFARSIKGYNPDYTPMETTDGDGMRIRNVLRFTMPQGTHALYGSPHGGNGHEEEYIMHPNSVFHIDPYPRLMRPEFAKATSSTGKAIMMWNARLVTDGVGAERATTDPQAKAIYKARKSDYNYIPGQPITRDF